MASVPETGRRLPSRASLLLIAAAIVAVISIGVAVLRSGETPPDLASPTAADWRTVGWAQAERGDGEAAASAYRRAAAIEPGNAENWSSLAEILQSASTSVVPEAAEAVDKALRLNPGDPRARYFRAVQKDLQGDHRGALDDWLALLKDTPPQAPWRADLLRTINQVATLNKIDVTGKLAAASAAVPAVTSAIPGPTAEQLAAASAIPPGQQDAMARSMVERLAARLQANPRDADGWIRLIRSWTVLGDADHARQALARGLAAFHDDPATQGRLKAAAAQFGVS